MQSALIAFNPYSGQSSTIQNLCAQVAYFQEKKALQSVDIVTLIHPNFFPISQAEYTASLDKLKENVKESLEKAINNCFKYNSIEVLEAPSSNNDELVLVLSQLARERSADVLTLGLNIVEKGYRWDYGGISQTATLSSTGPTLLLNVRHEISDAAPSLPTTLIALDTSAAPSLKAVEEIERLLLPWCSSVRLIHVQRKPHLLAKLVNSRQAKEDIDKVMHETQTIFKSKGFKCESQIIREKNSIAETISDCSKENDISMTLITSPLRDFTYRMLWGSTAQNLLLYHKKPLLVLRQN